MIIGGGWPGGWRRIAGVHRGRLRAKEQWAMEKHGFAVIGIQGVGGTHIKGIQSLPNAELVALVDIDEAAVNSQAQALGVRAFTDYEAMLKLPEVEIVN